MGKHTRGMLPDADRALHVVAELTARPEFRRDGRRVIGTESAAEIQEALCSAGYAITPSPPHPPRRGSRIGVYMAARYSHVAKLRGYRSDLESIGRYFVTSRWINGDQARAPGETELAAQARYAREDLEDVDHCSILIAYTEEPRSVLTCGGRHFEAGYAHSRGAQILLVGPRENIFYQLADAWFETWEACLASLGQSAVRRSA
jgi:hypothetical protein